MDCKDLQVEELTELQEKERLHLQHFLRKQREIYFGTAKKETSSIGIHSPSLTSSSSSDNRCCGCLGLLLTPFLAVFLFWNDVYLRSSDINDQMTRYLLTFHPSHVSVWRKWHHHWLARMKNIFHAKVAFCVLLTMGFLQMLVTGNQFHLGVGLAIVLVAVVWIKLQTADVHSEECQHYKILQELVNGESPRSSENVEHVQPGKSHS
jgi:hypothetical protein